MPRLLFLHLLKRVGTGALVIQLALSVPVVLSYLLYSLPPAAVRGGLVMPALVGTAPTVAYVTLPMAVGVATALEFSRMSGEGMIAVLYALRLSAWAICRPALTLAAGACLLGYVLANFVAPHYAGSMQDVLNVVRNSLNHRMLEPAHFYTFETGAKTLYLERWETPDIAVNLFMRKLDAEKMEEQTITAARAEFRRNDSGVIVALTNGSMQTRKLTGGDDKTVRITAFDEYAMALPMQGSGGLPARDWRGVYELSAPEFFAQLAVVKADHRQMGEWMAEAAKRFGVPALAIGHTLLGMALVLTFGNITGRRGSAGSLIVAAVPAAHILFLVALESLLRVNARFAILLIALAALEALVSAFMIARLNRSAPAVRLAPSRPASAPEPRAATVSAA